MPASIVYKRIVMQKDLNPYNNLYGGTMMGWLDEAGAIFATEVLHDRANFVTVKVSEILFKRPVILGDLLTFSATMTHVGTTSFAVQIAVNNERQGEVACCNITFVTLDLGHPTPHKLPKLIKETE